MKRLGRIVAGALLACSVLLVSCASNDAPAPDAASDVAIEPQVDTSTGEAAKAAQEAKERGESTATPAIKQSVKEYAEANGLDFKSQADKDDAEEQLKIDEGLEGRAPEGVNREIIGSDDRVTVDDTYQYPFSAIAYEVISAPCGCSWTGTGFMVRPNVLLTAAHCLVCVEHNKPADNISLFFGYHPDGSYEYGYFGPTTYWYGTSFPDGTYKGEDNGWDYGIVVLQENVGDYTGFFGVKSAPDKKINSSQFTVAGYRDGTLKYDTDSAHTSGEHVIQIQADALAGNSGSPLYDDASYAYGIYVASSTNPPENFCCRITDDIIWEIKEMESGKSEPSPPPTSTEQPADTKPPTNTEQDDLVVKPSETGAAGYVLPYADTHRYTQKELSSLSNWDLYIARNEIGARHGRKFKEDDLSSYFGAKSWYKGTLTREEFQKIEGILNSTEEANVDTILAIEKEHGSPYAP